MPRSIPHDRLERLIDCATEVFIERGYKRTQMADVADALGVAKGTLYLYVESKEALFDLVVRCAGERPPYPIPPELPISTPDPAATVELATERLAARRGLPALTAALSRHRVTNVASELEGIVRELYRTLSANRRAIKLIDTSARDRPDLAELWFRHGREWSLQQLERYLEKRIGAGLLTALPDVPAAARLILETTVFWAVHRHWDPHPQTIDEQVAEDTVTHFVLRALVKE